jgi:hypothetical protein
MTTLQETKTHRKIDDTVAMEIREFYKKVFNGKTADDKSRIDFLQTVATGRFETKDGEKTIAQALEELKATDPWGETRKVCEAMYAMWQWYLHPTERNRDYLVSWLKRAGIGEMVQRLPQYLNILLLERTQYFRRVFDKALEYAASLKDDPNAKMALEERKANIILAAAETVTNIEPDLSDYVTKRIPPSLFKKEYYTTLQMPKAA